MKTRLLLSMLPLIFPGVSWAESAREATPEPETPVRTTLPAASERMKIGLVLSGGGAKGVAHIGVIQALEENDIPIDYITGTSAGAIFGGLYAAGYSPQEMLELLVSKGFGYWSTGQIDPSLRYYFMANEPSPAMFNIPIVTKRDSVENARSAVTASLISPIPMSFAFMELFAPYTAQCGGDFNNLFVPFRCVASDVAARHKIVMRGGDFGDAIRSSMSFPIVFQPTRVGKMLLYDGGIYDNFPVDVMNADFGPDFILGIDVSTIEKGPQTSLMDQLDNLVIQSNDYYLDPATGIKIRFDLNRFGLLDFQQAREIYRIGYETTMAMMDSIKSRIPVRVPHQTVEARRAAFKSRTPELRFNNVDVTGGTPAQNHYIRYMFTDDKPDTFGIDQARTAFYRAVSNNKLRELSPHALYNDTTDLFNLKLHASVKNNLTAGVGGYITTSTNSYVFLNAGFSNYSFRSLSANISGWLGQSYQSAMLKGRFNLPTTIGTALDLQLVGTHEEYFHGDKMFFTRHDPSFVHHREVFGRLMFSMAAGTLSKLEIGVGAASVHYSFFQSLDNEEFNPYRDRNRFLLSQAFVKWEENTLNDINYPVRGGLYRVTGMAVGGNYKQKSGPDGIVSDREEPRWLQLEAVTKTFMPLCRHFSLGVESDIMLSTRKLLRDYNISIVAAPGFYPTAASYNHFDPEFRANSFLSLGLVPVYRYNDSFSARLSLNGFVPIRPIECSAVGRAVRQGAWIKNPRFFGELALNYHLPFGNVTAYCSYSSSTGNDWSVGLSFGVFVLSPQFLR